jgi:hypothetical protein
MLVMLSVLLAAAPLGAPAAHATRDRPTTCAVVEIGSDQAPRRRHSFRATRILDLEFETLLSGGMGPERSLQLRLYTPQGFLYQVLETTLDSRRGGKRRGEARLPVAGTSIMASGLYGHWKVVPHLDGRREPCGHGRSFVIRP